MNKHLLLTILCILPFAFCNLLQAQNLVPNPSFEEYTTCPNDYGQTYFSTGWNTNINTADYFNACNLDSWSVPLNSFGFQYPYNNKCKAYCGFYAYTRSAAGSEEYIGCQLATSLILGHKYYASFKVSLADKYPICGINKLGIKFTNKNYGNTFITNASLLNNKAEIYSNTIITDTINWTTIYGSFIADSAYNYILIGRFFDELNTAFICPDTNYLWSYYYIDDVCVSTDSSYCSNYSYTCGDGIANYKENNITISPNPVNSVLQISTGNTRDYNLKVYSAKGEIVLQLGKLNGNSEIDLTQYSEGMYFIQINSNDKIYNKKIIIEK